MPAWKGPVQLNYPGCLPLGFKDKVARPRMQVDQQHGLRPQIAVLTSGVLRRLIFTNFSDLFLKPLISAGYSVDYYGTFATYPYRGWQAGMQSYTRDPLFHGLSDDNVLDKVSQLVSAGGGCNPTSDIRS